MFKELYGEGRFLGYGADLGQAFCFFGSRFVGREDLSRLFPSYEFCFLKQVHGRLVVPANSRDVLEADGHFTRQPRQALVVQTADCVPILAIGDTSVCALHAGWRGVAANIIARARPTVSGVHSVTFGPHIGRDSFEVGGDVALQLSRACSPPEFFAANPAGKVLFDLSPVVRKQALTSFSLPMDHVIECQEDTRTSARFHSFRRDGQSAGRQFSFVVLNS